MDWLSSLSVEDIDFVLILIFGLGFLHKSWIEYDIARISALLTPKEDRTLLGDTFRSKTISLSWLMGLIGVVWIMRSVPRFEEPREVVVFIRVAAMVIFFINQYWCYRMRQVLIERLRLVMSGEPVDGQERML
jgi:hypothetical protein